LAFQRNLFAKRSINFQRSILVTPTPELTEFGDGMYSLKKEFLGGAVFELYNKLVGG